MLRLAKRLKVTRQALYNNDLGPVVAEYAELQRKNFSTAVAAALLRRPLEERIRMLEEENAELRQKLDGWIERWVTVEYNARLFGKNATNSSSRFRRRRARRSPSEKGGKPVDEMNEAGGGQGVKKVDNNGARKTSRVWSPIWTNSTRPERWSR